MATLTGGNISEVGPTPFLLALPGRKLGREATMSHSCARLVGAAGAALLLAAAAAPAPRPGAAPPLACAAPAANAQDPRPHCCFENARYVGACEVEPAPDETCATILEYLNNLQSQGKNYCNSTNIRGGWKTVPCEPKMKSD
jgi:hypothetical protein